ncbi:MAG: group III truncated hemoglobin [Burkholderiales bacterium]
MEIGEPGPRRKLSPLCDIIGRERVVAVVHDFYAQLHADETMRPFFEGIDDFTEHEALIADFWWTAMGGKIEQPRQFDMLAKHRALGLNAEALQRWIQVFEETLQAHLPPEPAQRWLQLALGIADVMRRHLQLGG